MISVFRTELRRPRRGNKNVELTMSPHSIDEESAMHPDDLPAGAIRCSACGTVGYQTDRYCPCCGDPLLRSCGSCGALIVHPIAYYCTSCGSELEGARSGMAE